MRIVSLAPEATEIAVALGLADQVVGATDDHDRPPDLVDASIVALREDPSGFDEDAVAAAHPDLILAPAFAQPGLRRRLAELARSVGPDVNVLTIDPATIEGVFNSIVAVGALASAEDAALELVETLRERLGAVEGRVQDRRAAGVAPTRVVALEWLDPPFAAGRWVPEQVRRAGGWELLGRDGALSSETSWEMVGDVDPETIVLMPRGLHLAETLRAWDVAPRPPAWAALDAVRRGQVFAVDAASYFTRPGPRLIDGIELLAELLDPDGFVDIAPPASWTPVI